MRAESYIDQIIGANHPDNPMGWMVNRDRVDRVQMCLDYVARRHRELSEQFPGGTITIQPESKSNPGELFGRDDWWGTVDITITVTVQGVVRFIEIIDYKDGRGWVSEKDNSQLYSYLIGKLGNLIHVDGSTNLLVPMGVDERVGTRMTIVQPKTNPVVRYYDPTPAEIRDKGRELVLAAKETDKENAPLVAGKHCRWCKHKKNCSAEAQQSIERIKPMTTEIATTEGSSLFEIIEQTFGDISKLPDEKLADLADAQAGIESIFDKVKEEIRVRIESGANVPGWAMKPGNSKRVWNASDEEIEKKLKARRMKMADIYPPKLISPAQVMKHPSLTDSQKKRIEDELITTMEGKLTLKQVSREQKSQSAVDMFNDVVTQCDTGIESEPQTEVSFL